MVLRVEQGKGGRDREIPLSPTLLAALREYYRWMRPQTYLFPGTHNGWRADAPITVESDLGSRAPGRAQGRDRQARHAAHAAAHATRRICSKPAPTCARFSCCWATPICRTRRCICTCPAATCRPRRIRWSSCRSPPPVVLPRSRL